MKQQIIVIHGGRTFKTREQYLDSLKNREVDIDKFKARREWRDSLGIQLGEGFEVFAPKMPNGHNAVYEEWKIWFERMLPFLRDGAILVGHSLGGIFLVKYLSENAFAKKISALMLVAAPCDDENLQESLGSFIITASLENVSRQAPKIYLLYSKDDLVVPFSHMGKYKNMLPLAKEIVFEDKQHFTQESFAELVELIREMQ